MRHRRIGTRRGRKVPRYTHLSACVSQQDGCFTVQVRLYDESKPKKDVWGEEVADSIEAASALLDILVDTYAIPQERVNIRLQMENVREGTRH